MSGEPNEKPVPAPRRKWKVWLPGAILCGVLAVGLVVVLFAKGFRQFGYAGVIFVAVALVLSGIITAFEDDEPAE